MSITNTPQEDMKAIPKNVSMYPDQWAVIEEVDQRYDFRNLSTALRFIVNEYRRLMSVKEAEKQAAP